MPGQTEAELEAGCKHSAGNSGRCALDGKLCDYGCWQFEVYMEPTIRFWISGDPVPQPRHRTRVVRSKRGPVAHTYEATGDHPIHTWKEAIAWQARIWRPTEPMAGPLSLELVFGLHAPASMIRCAKTNPHLRTEHAIGRSDIDNYAKAVMDVLTALRFWQNDNQIVDLHARKLWRLPSEPAGVHVTMIELPEEEETNV